MATYNLQYRTYDQLLAEIQSDFKSYYLEDFINPQEFIKVAKRCNYELGLKIFKTSEAIIDIEKGKGKLPNSFNVLNFAFMLSKHTRTEPIISGTHTERVPVQQLYNPGVGEINICADPVVNAPTTSCNSCGNQTSNCNCNTPCNVQLNCKGEQTVLIQKLKYETRTWNEFYPLRIIDNGDVVDMDCPNKKWQVRNSAYIKNGFIYPSFQTGKIYINYQGLMEDEEGNLLVPDHDLLNEFYEYAVKQRVLENMIMNGENVNQMQIQLIEQRLRAARNNAYSLVNTPDFNELRRIWEVNRKAQYSNYYDMFRRL
jgi:hypothetical protein